MLTKPLKNKRIDGEKAYIKAIDNSGAQTWCIEEEIQIGRSPDNQISIANPFISRNHAKIEKKGKDFVISDLESQNGTYLNQSRIAQALLQEGDRIQIGKTNFIFTFKENNKTSPLSSKNTAYQKQLKSIPKIAQTDLAVLVLGESGCGKELVAKAIHDESLRSNGPLITINCSALSSSVIESELFGHKKGSFTDASSERKGAFEAARGGTLILVEIGDLPIDLQPKLLRALENKEIRPLGSDININTDVRIIASTHKPLREMVQKGSFRKDLYFRLNILSIQIPSLCERMEDFESLLYSFAKEMRVSFSHNAIKAMKKHTWPGNIRELKNSISRASALFSDGETLEASDIPLVIEYLGEGFEYEKPEGLSVVQGIEYDLIRSRLLANNGNQRLTALELGIPKSTLNDKVKRLGLDPRNPIKASQ